MATFPQLPLIEADPLQRADAARNRERILCTAARLFGERGVRCVSMDDVADAAGVGKGTVFRRFGSRAALAQAVLSEHERAFQEHFIRGSPPLGPGAPPCERLCAFGEGMLDHLGAHAELVAAAEVGGAHLSSAPFGVYRQHVTLLMREADPRCDAELLADMLLAGLSAQQFIYLHNLRSMPLARLKAGWRELVHRALAPAPSLDAAHGVLAGAVPELAPAGEDGPAGP
jgi:AcrR family transcriptional regulator